MESHDEIGVLTCDDDAAIRTLLRIVVETTPGLRFLGEASNGDEAIAEARRLQPDVILLDLAMPGRSGLAALPRLRAVAPRAAVIVLSGFAASAFASDAVALGAESYLEKGASPAEIVGAIEAVASLREHRSHASAPKPASH